MAKNQAAGEPEERSKAETACLLDVAGRAAEATRRLERPVAHRHGVSQTNAALTTLSAAGLRAAIACRWAAPGGEPG